MVVPNTMNFPTPFDRIPSWVYSALGAVSSQLIFRALTDVFWSICYCQLDVSVGESVCSFLFYYLADITLLECS